jgi:hypothetical protein
VLVGLSWNARHKAPTLPNFDALMLNVRIEDCRGLNHHFGIACAFDVLHSLYAFATYEIASIYRHRSPGAVFDVQK